MGRRYENDNDGLPETPELRSIYVRRKFFELILQGRKTAELRVGFPTFKAIKSGDRISFSSGNGEMVEVEITGIRAYSSVSDVLRSEDLNKLVPGLSKADAGIAAKAIFSESDILEHGLLFFEFQKI